MHTQTPVEVCKGILRCRGTQRQTGVDNFLTKKKPYVKRHTNTEREKHILKAQRRDVEITVTDEMLIEIIHE